MSAWFAFPTTLYGSKQALIAADILKVERWEAVGLIAGLYTWSVENADRNGLLENVSASVLADALGYPKKKSEALVKALAEAGMDGSTEAAYKEFTAKYAALVTDTDESQPPEMCRE